MSSENSPFAEQPHDKPMSPREMLESRYPEDSDNLDEIVRIVEIKGTRSSGLIEVPDWNKEQTEQAESIPQTETPFEIGEPVVVRRSSGEIDYHWKVIGQNQRVDQKTGMTIMVTMVEKVVGDKVYTKSVATAELREIQRKMDDKLAMDLGESAVGSVVEVQQDLPDFLPQTRKATAPDTHADGEYHGGNIEAIAARSGIDSDIVARAALESIVRQRAVKRE